MPTSTTPTTTLEAVNQCLFAIGEAPVNQVEDQGLADAAVALQTLSNVNREVQQIGWHWNTEIALPLAPDLEGNVVLPQGTLKVDTAGADACLDVVQRAGKLYDRRNHTFTFTRPVTVDLVLLMDFEDIPQVARDYITLRAARRFQQNTVGSQELASFQNRDEVEAKSALLNAEAETQGFNMRNNWDVARVLNR